MINNDQLQYLRQQTKSYKALIEDLRRRKPEDYDIRDFGFIVAAGSKLCESLLSYIAKQRGYEVDYERGMVITNRHADQEYGARNQEIHIFDFCIDKTNLLPEECRSFVRLIKQVKDKAVYAENDVTYELVKSFSKAMEGFILWFEKQTDGTAGLCDIVGKTGIAIGSAMVAPLAISAVAGAAAATVATAGSAVAATAAVALSPIGILAGVVGVAASIFRGEEDGEDEEDEEVNQELTSKSLSSSKSENINQILSNVENVPNTIGKSDISEKTTENAKVEDTVSNEALILEMSRKIDLLLQSNKRIENKVDEIEQHIKMLTGEINAFQRLTERQLSRAESEEEAERLISSYTDECANCIVENTIDTYSQNSDRILEIEERKLIQLIGENGWKKLNRTSQRFLVSARLMFQYLQKLQDVIDYSGVCVLVTKALEVEMDKRFYYNFLAYLRNKYKNDYSKYHTALLYKHKIPLKEHSFTMGNIAFVLCLIDNRNDNSAQIENNKIQLLNYAKKSLLSKYTEEEIKNLLREYAEAIEHIRKRFRNPSAHTNELKRVDAEDCLNIVLDVQKLLKRMLDSFDS